MVVSVSVNNLDTRDYISLPSDREGQHARSYAMGPHPLYRCTVYHHADLLLRRCLSAAAVARRSERVCAVVAARRVAERPQMREE